MRKAVSEGTHITAEFQIMKPLGRRFDAYQSFLLGCKTYWSNTLYPQVKSECYTNIDEKNYAAIEMASRDNVTYQYYSYLDYPILVDHAEYQQY